MVAATKRGILNGFTTPLVLISFLKAVLDINIHVVKVKVLYAAFRLFHH